MKKKSRGLGPVISVARYLTNKTNPPILVKMIHVPWPKRRGGPTSSKNILSLDPTGKSSNTDHKRGKKQLRISSGYNWNWNRHKCCRLPNFREVHETVSSVAIHQISQTWSFVVSYLKISVRPNWLIQEQWYEYGIYRFLYDITSRWMEDRLWNTLYKSYERWGGENVSVWSGECLLIRLIMSFNRNDITYGSNVSFDIVAQSNDCLSHVAIHFKNLISISLMFHAWHFTFGT
jgi:hypothetical protein